MNNLFNGLSRSTTSKVICLFELPLMKIINFARLFHSTIVLINLVICLDNVKMNKYAKFDLNLPCGSRLMSTYSK